MKKHMPSTRSPGDRTSFKLISRRFAAVVALVFCLALVSATAAVWFTATPQLAASQTRTVEQLADNAVAKVTARLGELTRMMEFVASVSAVKDVVTGAAENADVLLRMLQEVEPPPSGRYVAIYDVLEEPVAAITYLPGAQNIFSEARIKDAARRTIANDAAGVSVVYSASDTEHQFLIAAPVLIGGFVEGAAVGVFALTRDELEALSDWATLTLEQGSRALGPVPSDNPGLVRRLADFGLLMRLQPDHRSVATMGVALVQSVSLAVAAALLAPFAVFFVIGRRVLVRPHEALARSEALLKAQKKELAELAAAAEKANDAILITDIDGKTIWANPGFERISGFTADEMVGRAPGPMLQGPETDPKAVEKIRTALEARQPVLVEIANYRRYGGIYWISLSISPLFDEAGVAYGFMAISRDVTQERRQREALVRAAEEIEHRALHDALTQLPNRYALDQALSQRLADQDRAFTIVRIDLDRFKFVNDSLGHAAGDEVLKRVADHLTDAIGADDVAARIGGDEFVLLLNSDDREAARLSERLRRRIGAPMTFGRHRVQIGASFGIATAADGRIQPDEIMVAADAALYLAKEEGRNAVKHYSPAVHEAVVRDRELAEDLREALARRDFVPYFQPRFDAKTRALVCLETLVRWPSEKHGLLLPGQFLPLAERMAVLTDIDAVVLDKAFAAVTALNEEGLQIPRVSLNVTLPRLKDPLVLETVTRMRPADVGVSFEILESVLLDNAPDELLAHLDSVREAGIEIEIDDFGSGHASMIALRRARPDAMKIDRRLIRPIIDSPTDRSIVGSLVEIGQALDIHVVAEGVETEAHAVAMAELGCDSLQGFHLARPMPADDLAVFLRARRARPVDGLMAG